MELRSLLMRQAIAELQSAGVEPDVWKLEGLDRREDCEAIVATAQDGGRDRVSCIVLGHGEDATRVQHWLTVAAGVPGFIGFAVGRTVFWDPLIAMRAGNMTRDQAVAEIAERYLGFAKTYQAEARK